MDGCAIFAIERADHLRCTIDTLRDYINGSQLFAKPNESAEQIDWRVLVERLRNLPMSPKYRIPYRDRGSGAESVSALGTAQLGLPYFYCVINAIGLQVIGASTDSMDIARGILRARR
jgi:hypothetical protein